MLQRLKAVIVVQSGEWNQIPFRDSEPEAPLRAIEEEDANAEKWLRLADTALNNNDNPHRCKDRAA
jgi:hypothetical protein